MISYFYERRSESLYDFIEPRPSRSTVNLAFYCSRGYVVFVPDIRYQVGHPGESAYNCIVSGVKAMCAQYPFIDSTRLAIQGQSWGGYQTAYLVTRTPIFAVAGAGAPVSNMTSAYGGIRWASGVCRQMQYEHGQSRVGKSLWDKGGLDLYLESSPLFKADQIRTPLLIMHNDVITTTNAGNQDMSDYYNYLAYQSYMGSMYGGGYGGYGYGGYGDYYSNYYNYAMMAQYYGSSSTTTSTSAQLDRDRYYFARLYGPSAADDAKRPTLKFTYSVPNK